MGAWGAGIFENDTASDWAFGLEGATDASLIERTLTKVLAVGAQYLEARDAEEGLAAAEAVARMRGNWGGRDAYTEPMDKWIETVKIAPGDELVQKALAVVRRVLSEPSELMELWAESDEFDTWKAALEDLRSRLGR
jgi:hypothetical protein